MERFTNDYQQLLIEVKRELLAPVLQPAEEVVVSYLECPWFAGGQATWHLVHGPLTGQYYMVWRTWDAAYDLGRFAVGVYNLDRLCLRQRVFCLTTTQQQHLAASVAALDPPDTLEQPGCIVLDGVEYELRLPGIHLRWRVANAHFARVEPLLTYLKSLTATT